MHSPTGMRWVEFTIARLPPQVHRSAQWKYQEESSAFMNTSTDYRYAEDECDVIDKDKLRRYRAKRAEWISLIHSDDPHSIWRQISSLLWDEVLFRTINDLRRRAVENVFPSVGFNGSVLRMFDTGFVTTQVTAIRRLTERQPKNPDKGIVSLRRLVSDIRTAIPEITREVYVSYDGLPYDSEPVEEAWIQARLIDRNSIGPVWGETSGPKAWSTSQMVQANFDKLAKYSDSATRSRNDVISQDWFTWLDERLDVCNDLREYTNKFVAHAADPVSRTGLTESQTSVTLNSLRQCQKAIYDVAAFIYGPVLWEGSYSAVPVPQFNHLENIEKGWVTEDDLRLAHEIWNRHFDDIERWALNPTLPCTWRSGG